MVRVNGDPVPKSIPTASGLPLYVPTNDVIKKININDNRQINPATNQPFKNPNTRKSVSVDAEHVKRIIAHAKSQNVDPYTALAISLQESNIGQTDENYGHVIGKDNWKNIPENLPMQDRQAYALVNTIKNKMQIAKNLGYDKQGEAYALQAYNGYGNLYPSTEADYHKGNVPSFYEIPVSHQNPLRLSQNPAYGKTIISLRDELLKKSPEIQELIARTQPYQMPNSPNKLMIKVKK